MQRKKEPKKLYVATTDVQELQTQYINELETNPEFSLEVDPTNKYRMTKDQKEFIRHYVQFKNVVLACQLAGIDEKQGRAYYLAYSSQQEIRRINMAMYHRQFSAKLLNLDEIGGYLTSLLTDQVPMADRLESKDKLKVAQMIIDLNELKRSALSDPTVIDTVEVSEQIKDLSVKSIKQLISASHDTGPDKEKDGIIEQLDDENNLSGEEIAYLKTLPTEELLQLVENGGEEDVHK